MYLLQHNYLILIYTENRKLKYVSIVKRFSQVVKTQVGIGGQKDGNKYYIVRKYLVIFGCATP